MNFGIKAKKAIKKVAAMSIGAAMIGSTLFGAAAADLTSYPNPFIENGMWNTVIVVGADAAASDVAGAIDISATLSQQATTAYTTSTTTTTVEGGISLATGDNKIYLGNELGDAGFTTITEDDFPNLLADGTFMDDAGNEFEYSQQISIGSTTYAEFTFSTSGNTLDDPALIIDLGTNPATPVYDLIVDFDEPTNLSGSFARGQELTLFGETFTVGSSSTATVLQLLGGATDVDLDWGETKTVTFLGEDYEITLVGVQNTNPDTATLRINGDTKTITQGTTKKIGGVDVYAYTVNYYGLDAYPGDAIITLGADEIWLESGDEIAIGSKKEDIDNTLVTITGADNEEVSQIKISVSAQDNDYDHLGIGEFYTDPIFGTIKVTFADVVNGPDITVGTGIDANTDRRAIEISPADKNTLQMKLTDANGNSKTFEWAYDSNPTAAGDPVLADSDGETFAIYEGAVLDEEGGDSNGAVYTVLNSNGEYSGFIKIDKLDDDDCDEMDLDIEEVLTGTTIVSWDNQDLNPGTKDFTFRGKTYTVTCVGDDSGITIVDQTATKTNVYPFIQLYSGYDQRIAFIDDIPGIINATSDMGDDNTTDISYGTLIFPTGEVAVVYDDNEANETTAIRVAGTALVLGGEKNITIGTHDYRFDCGASATYVECSVSPITSAATSTAGILIVEAADQTNADAKETIYFLTDDTAGTSSDDITILAPVFSSANAITGLALDDNDLTAYVDSFGTYVLRDVSGDQDADTLITVPQRQMYASVYVSSEDAETTTTSSTAGVTIQSVSGVDVARLDTEVTDKTAKPMILVGGPCVNDLVAELAADGDFRYGCVDWPGSNFGIIEYAENAFGGSKAAIVLAGTTAADTRRACKVLKDFGDYNLAGTSMKVTGTSTTPVVEPYVETTEETTE